MVLILCVSLLLLGSPAISDEYHVVPIKAGEIAEFNGNMVTDYYIEAVRELQIEVGNLRTIVNENPAVETETFMDGVLWGALGGIVVMILVQ